MNLINFKGLNCFFNCVVSVSAHFGVPYIHAFATLWSETELNYAAHNDAFWTGRMLENLEIMGIKLNEMNGSAQEDVAAGLSSCPLQEFLLVAMDAYHIPWSPIYQALHDHHYFLAQKESPGAFLCFDPTYDRQHMRMDCAQIIPHAYDLWQVESTARNPLPVCAAREAHAVLCGHPKMRERLLRKMDECAAPPNDGMLAKYVAALINNRYLFAHFLRNTPATSELGMRLFGNEFFSDWEAVKNGLYKASLAQDNQSILRDVRAVFAALIDAEIAFAYEIIHAAF